MRQRPLEKGPAPMASVQEHEVGGVLLERPFKVRRLGHVGFCFENLKASHDFYRDLLGLRISDTIDLSERAGATAAGLGDRQMYFTRYGSDHHSLVFLSRAVQNAMSAVDDPMMDIQQLAWQVDSLSEIKRAYHWLRSEGQEISKVGRDMPGSNWHVYFNDPDGHRNELFYGIEQVGWDGVAKPLPMFRHKVSGEFSLPQQSETQEVEDAIRDGIDVFAGPRDPDIGTVSYDVEGVLLQRPFRVTGIGPVGLFARDMQAELSFYTRIMGFKITERVLLNGHECVFMRAGDEHHSLALYPFELKRDLRIRADSTCAVIGFQVASYRQLKDAVHFLREHEVPVFQVALPFSTGIDFSAHFLDPDGHMVRLYHSMERVDWEGRPKPAELRRAASPDEWPDVLQDGDGSFAHVVFQGPLG